MVTWVEAIGEVQHFCSSFHQNYFSEIKEYFEIAMRERLERMGRQNKERSAFGRGVELCTIFVFVELCAPVKNLKRICIICGLR